MYYKELAKRVRYFKETEKGIAAMCRSIEIMRNESESDKYHDLMSVLIIRRGKEDENLKEPIFDYLSGVFKGDITKIEQYTDTDSDPESERK